MLLVLFAGLLAVSGMLWFAYGANDKGGFPIDDAWIHLQFAKNVHDTGVFAYFPGDAPVSGSTSPLYTLLLSIGFFVCNDEFLLSYFFGITFFLLSVYLMFRLCAEIFPDNLILPTAAALLLVLEPRLLWIALSGMETTMFIALLLAFLLFWRNGRSLPLGLCAGALVWTRPEGIILIASLAAAVLFQAIRRKERRDHEKNTGENVTIRAVVAFSITALLYVGFNMWLSGTFLPNTASAKIAYYSSGTSSYWSSVWNFLTGGHMIILSVFAGIGIAGTVMKWIRRAENPMFPSMILWVAGMILAYKLYLPYLYHEGRYLMPVLPFIILFGVRGVSVVSGSVPGIARKLQSARVVPVLQVIVLLTSVTQFALAAWEKKEAFAADCRYINERQVRAALWLRDNTPPDAIVATHDIGALGFYSGRRIVDMVGLISPAMIPHLGDLSGLRTFLIRENVTHLAVLRNWFEVDNQLPLFRTDERFPEIMEVFAFDSVATHFVSGAVQDLWVRAADALRRGNGVDAERMLIEALRLDPGSSKSYYLLAVVSLRMGKPGEAEQQLRSALALKPGSPEARLALAEIALRQHGPAAAVDQLKDILREFPDFSPALRALEITTQMMKSYTTKDATQ
jgi:hypothetical protein